MFEVATIGRVLHASKDVHPSFVRLLEAVMAIGVMNSSMLAAELNESPQTITNWARRGVSKAGALNAQQRYGISATYILTGEGPPLPSQSDQEVDPVLVRRYATPSIDKALAVIAAAAERATESERASIAGLLRELVMDPKRNSADLIPILTRRLS
ncbi:hypothetical protein [Pseudorhodoferax soli]|uniref:hypothetical protein n=1 Tax=Pseudorhodoferax soli TaxID=545864 RepID=UPI0011C01BD6|nr:hypothetical protein [Pseudorhodoferax soli]